MNKSIDLPKFVHPFTCLVAGSTGSGKTVLVRDILANHQPLIANVTSPLKCLWCHGIGQDLHKVSIPNVNISYQDGLVSEEYIKSENPDIVIVDDLMEKASDKSLAHFFTRGSHHLGFSVIFIVQNLFAPGTMMRTISLNCMYVIIMRMLRDKSSIGTFGRQAFPGKLKFFMEAYEHATAQSFGYLVCDFSQQSKKESQLRTGIIPVKGVINAISYQSK